ncbi:MAG: glycosyltransferase [Planctomycetota bacterium]
MPPAVSINLCCYNSEKYLRETLESIVSQTYKNWELVIINDGSTDSTEAIVKEYTGQGLPIVYYCQQNHGLGYSRNEALKRSSGDYIAFIDHDDVWLPEKLAQQVAVFEKQADVDFVYTNYYDTRDRKRVIKYKDQQPEGYVFASFLQRYPVHVSTAMVRRKAFAKLKTLFDPDLHLTEEYDLFMRILYNAKAAYLARPLATYRHHGEMNSVTKEVRLIKETISVIDNFRLLDRDFETKHAGILKIVAYRNNFALAFKLAKDELTRGRAAAARDLIRPYKYFNIRAFVFFGFTCLPGRLASWLWSLAIKIKNVLTPLS